MPRTTALAILLATLAVIPAAPAADRPLLPGEAPPVVAAPDFEGPLDASWSIAHGTWTPERGILTAVELPENKHVAVLHHNVGLQVAVIECEFETEGAFVFYVGCDGKTGHIGRVVVTPASLMIAEDSVKPSHTLATLQEKCSPGKWHRLRVEWRGPDIAARLDGKELQASHPYLANAKTRSWLAVGKSVKVRRLTINGLTTQP